MAQLFNSVSRPTKHLHVYKFGERNILTNNFEVPVRATGVSSLTVNLA